MKSTSRQVKLRIPEAWFPKIEEHCIREGIPLEAPAGRSGGVPEWIKRLVAERIGETMFDPHEQLSAERKGTPNAAHQANIRLWLATKALKTPGNQLGMPLATTTSVRDFLATFGLGLRDFAFICDLSKTPDETTKVKNRDGWDSWELVVAEVHRNNALGLEPGFYKTGLRPGQVLDYYGKDAFCPRVLTHAIAHEADQWLDNAQM